MTNTTLEAQTSAQATDENKTAQQGTPVYYHEKTFGAGLISSYFASESSKTVK